MVKIIYLLMIGAFMAKTTMQNIADALNISRVSVWKVFNNQRGVSDTLKKQVIMKANELNYFKPILQAIGEPSKEKTVSVIVSRPESAIFWTNIIHRVAQELARCNINLMYAYVPSSYSQDFLLPNSLTNGTVEGAIILNIYDRKILKIINKLSIPKVYLDTMPDFSWNSLDGDLILIEGKYTLSRMTDYLIQQGYQRIGFIGDIHYAQTNLDRFNGFLETMKKHQLPIDDHLCLTKRLEIHSYLEEMNTFLNNLTLFPEAFICASDYVASFIYQYLVENPQRLTHDILVTGFDGSMEYPSVTNNITTADVDTNLLGKRLAHQIRFRLEHPSAPYETTYIMPKIRFYNNPIKSTQH